MSLVAFSCLISSLCRHEVRRCDGRPAGNSFAESCHCQTGSVLACSRGGGTEGLAGWATLQGHEFMGVVEAVGPEVKSLKKGDRAVASFEMACGSCVYCKASFFSGCDRTNPRWVPLQQWEPKLAQTSSEPAWAASGSRRCGFYKRDPA